MITTVEEIVPALRDDGALAALAPRATLSRTTTSQRRRACAEDDDPNEHAEELASSCDAADRVEKSGDEPESDFERPPSSDHARANPSHPASASVPRQNSRMQCRRKHKDKRRDWDAHGVRFRMPRPSLVYVLVNSLGRPYVGSTAKCAHQLVVDHNSGTRRSTRGRGPWTMAVSIGPFRNPTAASRFESLVKVRGSNKGVDSKFIAAKTALRASPDIVLEDGIRITHGPPPSGASPTSPIPNHESI